MPEKHPKVSGVELQYITQDKDKPESGEMIKWIHLFKYRQTAGICTTRFISDWVWWFFLFWTPGFLNKIHGINLREVVLPLIVIYTVSSVGGIGGGWISSKFIKMGKSIDFARKITILLFAVVVLPVMLVSQIENLWLAVALISVAAAGHQGWASNMVTIISDISGSIHSIRN